MAQGYLSNQFYLLNYSNDNIEHDIQSLSELNTAAASANQISANINNYATNLYGSEKALTVLNKNKNLFDPSDLNNFSNSLNNAENNLSGLENCLNDYNTKGVACSFNKKKSNEGTNTGTNEGTNTGTNNNQPNTGTNNNQPNIEKPNAENDPSQGVQIFTAGNREFFQEFSLFNKYDNSIYSGMPIIEGLNPLNNLYSDQQDLIEKLNDFNKNYNAYIKCNNFSTNENPNCDKTNLNKSLNDLNFTLANFKTDIDNNNKNNNITSDEYQTKYQNIINTYDQVLDLRNELDNKVKTLYNPEKSYESDYKKTFDATIYSGILMTALATSVLFYVFNHL